MRGKSSLTSGCRRSGREIVAGTLMPKSDCDFLQSALEQRLNASTSRGSRNEKMVKMTLSSAVSRRMSQVTERRRGRAATEPEGRKRTLVTK